MRIVMIKKSLFKLLVIAVVAFGVSTQPAVAEEISFTKMAKVIVHGIEVYAGLKMGGKVHWRLAQEECVNMVATASLLFHGFYGLNKQLKILKRLENFLK